MAKLTGAEMPAKLIVQGQIGVVHTVDPPVQMVSQEELRKMAEIEAEIARQAPKFSANGHGTAGNGQSNRY